MKNEFETRKKFTVLEAIGFFFLLRLYVCISGYLFVFCVFRYFGISAFVPFTWAYSYGDSSVFLATLAIVPLAVGCILHIPVFINHPQKKWLYFPIAIALMFLETRISMSYANSQLAPYLAIGLGIAFLLLSYRLQKVVSKATVVWVIFLAFALAFTLLNTITAIQLRNTFAVSTDAEGSYTRLLTINDQVYLVRCEVIEADNEVSIIINRGDYKIVDQQETAGNENDGQDAAKIIHADKVTVR
ncbi:MAG TPA: hypothetical protein VFF80_03295 [Bacillota bacterium]|nr:hypothetical protein [Bacillota bacterium]